VVIINEALARQDFPNEDPSGQRITFDRVPDSTSFWRTIVGVAASDHVYAVTGNAHLVVRTRCGA
ncbi:MAG: hypothetical protein ACREOG_22335, partial [Gemmatimonadaceae bacterium]